MKKTVLNNKLFDQEREDLKEYEKLKTMKFVLEELRQLDFKAIEKKKVDSNPLISENEQINLYLGRK